LHDSSTDSSTVRLMPKQQFVLPFTLSQPRCNFITHNYYFNSIVCFLSSVDSCGVAVKIFLIFCTATF